MIQPEQKFSQSEITRILKEIKATPNITAYSEKELQNVFKEGITFSARSNENHELEGLTFAKEIVGTKYSELAVLIVFPEFRNRGLGRELTTQILEELKGKSIYTSSRNPVVQKWLHDNDFKEAGLFTLPKDVLFYLMKTKLSLHKLMDARKWLLPGWRYYLKN